MKFLARWILLFMVNAFSLWFITNVVRGFSLTTENMQSFLEIALVFTLLNIFVRPVLKIFFAPLLLLTFGLGIIVVNGLLIALLDFLLKNLTIENGLALLYATLMVSVTNFIFHVGTHQP